MNFQDILKIVTEVIIIPLLPVLTGYLIKLIKNKTQEISKKTEVELYNKYICLLSSTITKCVVTTNQTYVDTLKEKGEFGIEAQKEAFSRTYNAVLSILGEEATTYLTNIIGDFQEFVTNSIEAEVKWNK